MTQSPAGHTGELILIVDDNAKNLKLVRDILQVKGFRTLEADTAEEGLELARAHQPDLILMDIQLPGMDGVTALGQLRADALTASLKVVAVTAFAMKEEQERIMAAGFLACLTKPLDIRHFPDQVRDFCRDGVVQA
ncbi:MAG TPA: response regulator [Chloroflexota bacterium]|nr:response regulator [Chloroflexota bacterium]